MKRIKIYCFYKFQFYNSSINTIKPAINIFVRLSFQFYNSSINTSKDNNEENV